MSDNANFLNDRETVEYFNILMEDHKNVMKFAQETVLQRQKMEAERNTQLKSRQSKGKKDINDSNMGWDACCMRRASSSGETASPVEARGGGPLV